MIYYVGEQLLKLWHQARNTVLCFMCHKLLREN